MTNKETHISVNGGVHPGPAHPCKKCDFIEEQEEIQRQRVIESMVYDETGMKLNKSPTELAKEKKEQSRQLMSEPRVPDRHIFQCPECGQWDGHRNDCLILKRKLAENEIEEQKRRLEAEIQTMAAHEKVPEVDMVNHPPHYTRGPKIALGHCDTYGQIPENGWLHTTFELSHKKWIEIECIQVIRHIKDGRLFSAMKYIWRVAFGGKTGTDDREDIEKAIWCLNDWLENPVD